MAIPSDLDIARSALLKPLDDIAHELGIGPHLLEPYGGSVVKIKLAAIDEPAGRGRSTWWSPPSPPRRSARGRPRPPLDWARGSATSASGPRSRSGSRRW